MRHAQGIRHTYSGDEGFTLAELLVSLGILSLIMVMLGSSLSFGIRNWRYMEEQSGQINEARIVGQFLEDLLAQSLPLRADGEALSEQVAFEGAPHDLRFVSVLPERMGGRPLAMRLRLTPIGELALEWCALSASVRLNCDSPNAIDVLEGIDEFAISYFDGDRQIWEDDWVRRDDMPRFVRITIMRARGHRSIVRLIPMLIGSDPTCIYDPTSGECRGQ